MRLRGDQGVFLHLHKAFPRRQPAARPFWQVSTVGPFENGNWQADIAKKGLLMEDVGLLGTVLFGGYLVDQAWVEYMFRGI